jgi:hypothetical protein
LKNRNLLRKCIETSIGLAGRRTCRLQTSLQPSVPLYTRTVSTQDGVLAVCIALRHVRTVLFVLSDQDLNLGHPVAATQFSPWSHAKDHVYSIVWILVSKLLAV